jgi:hypothetical protein
VRIFLLAVLAGFATALLKRPKPKLGTLRPLFCTVCRNFTVLTGDVQKGREILDAHERNCRARVSHEQVMVLRFAMRGVTPALPDPEACSETETETEGPSVPLFQGSICFVTEKDKRFAHDIRVKL